MARLSVNRFERIEKLNNKIHDETDAAYTTFIKGGKAYLQIDTYGSDKRSTEKKLSQSIQIDREFAEELMKILRATFSDIEQ